LLTILREIDIEPCDAIYVGDSLMKDIAMAQDANITDAFAAYGAAQHREQYELLKKVTHWTEADVKREKDIISRKEVVPSIVLKESLAEILPYFHLE
jgi:FMN phosphatase YigB (HAD superfamily)